MTMMRIGGTARYSDTVTTGRMVHCAGAIPQDFDAPMEQQAEQVFASIDRMLAAAGTDKSQLVSLLCFISDFAEADGFNAVYDRWIDPGSLPTRATVQVGMFDPRVKLEIIATAELPD